MVFSASKYKLTDCNSDEDGQKPPKLNQKGKSDRSKKTLKMLLEVDSIVHVCFLFLF